MDTGRRNSLLTLKRLQLGGILLQLGSVSQDQLDQALSEQRRQNNTKRLGEILVEMRVISEQSLLVALSRQLECPIVDLGSNPPSEDALRIISSEFAIRHLVLPLKIEAETLSVAMADPLDIQTIDDLKLLTGFNIEAVLASPTEIRRAGEQYYLNQMMAGAHDLESGNAEEEEQDVADLQKMAHEELVIRMVNGILNQAVQDRASDIHIEPFERELRVRYRIDGVLHEVNAPPKRYHPAIISRIKILSDMNIAERRLPQDGRMRIRQQGRQIDLRISTIPTLYGESAVMRILDKQTAMLGLPQLGMHGGMFSRYQRLINEPYGIILVTGPTGSGKTTTLYATLNEIYSDEKKIITVEDPVEYQLNGVNQIQVHPQIDLTFANGLRSIVRQDPDIIMVGEIRDKETAEIAVQAALTGHLVLSTLHTNDAAGAVSRLLDMGSEPFLVASSLIGVLAQRLVRVNCPRCKVPVEPNPVELAEIGITEEDMKTHQIFAGKGCSECRNLGFRGRSGIYEMLSVDDTVRQMIVKREAANVIKNYALATQDMITLLADGRRRVLQGSTTIKEVLRVVQREGFD